jgi:hypothetical protein
MTGNRGHEASGVGKALRTVASRPLSTRRRRAERNLRRRRLWVDQVRNTPTIQQLAAWTAGRR